MCGVGDDISLCPHCHCMTHTVDGHCGKCDAEKPLSSEEELDIIMEDLIMGHNFNYARKALLEWRDQAVDEERQRWVTASMKRMSKL